MEGKEGFRPFWSRSQNHGVVVVVVVVEVVLVRGACWAAQSIRFTGSRLRSTWGEMGFGGVAVVGRPEP